MKPIYNSTSNLCFKPLLSIQVLLPLLFFSSSSNGIEVFNDEKNTLALRGYISGIYYKDENIDEFNEGLSRWGFELTRKLDHGWQAGVTLEWGLTFDTNNHITIGGNGQAPASASDDNLFSRHGYIHFSHEQWGTFSVGKQWAAYYDMTAGTDILNYWGASVSGSFNFNSDGGISGTGRAEQALVWRKSYGDLHIALQLQAQNEPIEILLPEDNPLAEELNGQQIATIDNGYGLSVLYDWQSFTFGIGFNNNNVEIEADFGGSDANDEIAAVSITYGKNHAPGLYVSVLATKSKNHEINDMGQYIDATSSELIVKYTMDNKVSIYGGYNHLAPDEDSDTSEYEFHYNFAGIEYPLYDHAARLFLEARLDDITTSSGSTIDDNAYVLGATIYF
jgi:predicted porin